MEIDVYQGSTLLASGTLTVDTSSTPPTGTFTPDGGVEVTCNVSAWSSAPNGATIWSFGVSTLPNGSFPLGPNGNPFTYAFTGHENSNGTNPSGHVTWPNLSPEDEGDDPPTWQADATQDEPISRGTAAS